MSGLYTLYNDSPRRRRSSRSSSSRPVQGGKVSRYATTRDNETPSYSSEAEMAQALIYNNPHLSENARSAVETQYLGLFPGGSRDGGGTGTAIVQPHRADLKARRHQLLIDLENMRAAQEQREPAFPRITGDSRYYIRFRNG